MRLSGAPRVLLTADAVGGVWTYALDLAEGLAADGARVTLAVLGPPPSAGQARAAAAIEGVSLTCLEGPLDWLAEDSDALRPVAPALARLAEQVRADVIHLNSPGLAGLAVFDVPVLGVCHSCLASWWRSVKGGDLPQEFGWRRTLLARGYAGCNALVAPSHAFAQATQAEYDVQPVVVWNGRRRSAVSAARRSRFALTAGRLWDQGKDAATLDRAATRLRAPLVALGPIAGPDGSTIRLEALNTMGSQDQATTAWWMEAAPVFVSAARYEPFGLAVLEAAQAGAALVLSDIPTFRELWDGAAIFVPPGDAEGFAAAIGRLLEDEAACARAGAAAGARAARYTQAAMVRGTLAHYRLLAPAAFAADALEAAA